MSSKFSILQYKAKSLSACLENLHSKSWFRFEPININLFSVMRYNNISLLQSRGKCRGWVWKIFTQIISLSSLVAFKLGLFYLSNFISPSYLMESFCLQISNQGWKRLHNTEFESFFFFLESQQPEVFGKTSSLLSEVQRTIINEREKLVSTFKIILYHVSHFVHPMWCSSWWSHFCPIILVCKWWETLQKYMQAEIECFYHFVVITSCKKKMQGEYFDIFK